MAVSSLLSLMFLISTLLLASSSLLVAPNPTIYTFPLSPNFPKNQPSDPIKTHISLATTHSISLKFGTPPQTIPFHLDTGSSAVWFPCTSQYNCSDCDEDPFKIPLFIPERSSSSKFIDCQDSNCSRISSSNTLDSCQGCDCSRRCSYSFKYGKGSTSGHLLSETLDFPRKLFTNFLVGCSTSSEQHPYALAGFGRNPESLPSQLGLSKFSYCLSSRRFNDISESSDLVLYRGSSSDAKTPGVSYTPFGKNPLWNNSPKLRGHYYVDLLKVIVGRKSVNFPDKYLVPDDEGNGGTIVDSGSTLTRMKEPILDAVVLAIGEEMGNFPRVSADVEDSIDRNPCFNITGLKFEKIKFPKLTFEFKGGAKMELPELNYFEPVVFHNSSLACLTIVAKSTHHQHGPAIILGNIQQQNFYIEFDLKNDRFGFRKQTCNKK